MRLLAYGTVTYLWETPPSVFLLTLILLWPSKSWLLKVNTLIRRILRIKLSSFSEHHNTVYCYTSCDPCYCALLVQSNYLGNGFQDWKTCQCLERIQTSQSLPLMCFHRHNRLFLNYLCLQVVSETPCNEPQASILEGSLQPPQNLSKYMGNQ